MASPTWREFFDESFLSRLERLRLAAKSASVRSRPGVRRAMRLGDGLEFADHRAYVPGDDVRFIDWPYYARMERLLVRLFHEHSEAGVALLLDASASMAPGGSGEKFRAARRAAAALAYVAVSSGERLRLAAFAEELSPPLDAGRNRARFVRVLEWLAAIRPGGRTRLMACVEQFLRAPGGVGTVLILSDLLDCREELAGALARLRLAGAEVCLLHVYSRADASPKLAGPIVLEQAEAAEGRPAPRLTVAADPEVLASYRRRWAEFADSCRRTSLAEGALYVPAPTSVPMDKGLLLALRRAGVVQG